MRGVSLVSSPVRSSAQSAGVTVSATSIEASDGDDESQGHRADEAALHAAGEQHGEENEDDGQRAVKHRAADLDRRRPR